MLNFKVNLLKLIQVMQKVVMIYDLDYEVGNIEAFIDEFKKLINNNNKKNSTTNEITNKNLIM